LFISESIGVAPVRDRATPTLPSRSRAALASTQFDDLRRLTLEQPPGREGGLSAQGVEAGDGDVV
jgi:hypothetical protein